MNEKIINVFFGQDLLPYKDTERQVHYPISGSAFLGASNTTKIRFYFDYIGDSNTTWVSVAKLPNGKQGSRVLPIASDENGNYAELELSNWYTQAKGDVYIALQGYQGGVEYEYDSETELYEIHGTPTIQTTGSIKLAINYAPIGDSPDYNDEFSTYQDILALLGDKADVDNVYNKTEVDSALNGKVDKRNTTGQFLYGHRVSQEIEVPYSNFVFGNYLVQRDSNGEINVPTTPSDNSKATSKSYVDSEISSGLATKQDRLVSGTNIKTLTVDGVEKSLLGSGTIEVGTGGGSVEVDDELSTTSTNPVENRVITNELYNVRAELLGKSNSLSLSITQTAPTSSNITDFKKFDGTAFVDMADFNAYVNGLILGNSDFNTQTEALVLDNSKYIIDINKRVVRAIDIKNNFKLGQFNIYITQTGIPDRWYTYQSDFPSETGFVCVFYPLETEKVDISGLATKTELSDSIENLAQPYDSTTIYSIGDKVIYNDKLYSCLVNMSVAETWDSTHWSQISVASGFVDLDKAQVISGDKTFTSGVGFGNNTSIYADGTNFKVKLNSADNLVLTTSYLVSLSGADLGNSSNAFKDLYLSGDIYQNGVVQNSFKDYGTIDSTTSQTIIDEIEENGGIFECGPYTVFKFPRTTRTNILNTLAIKVSATGEGGNILIGIGSFNSSHSDFTFSRTLWSGVAHSSANDRYETQNITIRGNITDSSNNNISPVDLYNLVVYAKGQGWIS